MTSKARYIGNSIFEFWDLEFRLQAHSDTPVVALGAAHLRWLQLFAKLANKGGCRPSQF
jgi:hypothetical protein